MRTHHRSADRGTAAILTALTLIAALGCQGTPKEKPPIHINPNMDTQEKYKPNMQSRYFADGSVNRRPVENTVHTAALDLDETLRSGKDAQGNWLTENPMGNGSDRLERGAERYDIYCATCHGTSGLGDGPTVQKGFQKPPSYLEQRILDYTDGQLFDIITNGIRNMPRYSHQIPIEDRWAIVSHVRELQKNENSTGNP